MSEVFPGYSPAEISADALRQELLIRTLLLGVRTAMPVKVIAVHPGTGTPPSIGTVDVQPLVQTVDGTGKLWSLAEVYGASFLRLQAGSSAVVIDPQVGDIGLAVVCDRDISSVLAAGGALSGPGSARTHHLSDMIYLGSVVSIAALLQYIYFADAIYMGTPSVEATQNLSVGNGVTGTFTTGNGQTVDVVNGIVMNIY